MAKLTNGRTVCFVSDEKAEKLASILGMTIVRDEPEKVEEVEVPEPRRPRGRPRKVS